MALSCIAEACTESLVAVVATEEGVPAEDGVRIVCIALDTVEAFRDSRETPPEEPSLDKLAEPLEPDPGVPRKALELTG
jgi:hypothetical protein